MLVTGFVARCRLLLLSWLVFVSGLVAWGSVNQEAPATNLWGPQGWMVVGWNVVTGEVEVLMELRPDFTLSMF